MSRYPANIITKSPATPTGPTTTGRAPGVWRMDDVAYWIRQGLWPDANIPAADQYFPYVTMLMSTTATNAQQNNTFLDSSTNNLTITRNGNTTQGSLNPYGLDWANYFDGSGDYLTIANNAAFGMGTGDFTIECWVNPTVFTGSGNVLVDMRSGTEPSVRPDLEYDSSGTLNYRVNGSSVISGGTLVIGTWSHVVICRSGTTTKMFLNGTQVGSSYTDSNNYGSSAACRIGADDDGSPNAYVNGYMSNVRVVKGTAVYTANFTVPTAPLTAITNTSLLTCQSNRFRDNSANAFTITASGNTAVTPFSPFSPTYPGYTTAANGGSAYFDGSGDYLTAPYTTANFDWYTAGVDFTIEYWFFANSLTGTSYVDGGVTKSTVVGNRSATATTDYWSFGPNTSGTVTFYYYNGGPVVVNSTSTITANTWNHVAMTKTSSGITIFVNGIAQTTTAISGTPQSSASFPITVGQGNNTSYNGYVSDLRIVRGTAIYSGNFTPPTSPLTAVTNTKLLLNATNAGIFDSSTINDMETVGNAQVSTTQAKFGTTSAYFDGSGDNLFMPSAPSMNFGTGNWTIECWVYVSTRTTNYPLIFGNNRGSFTTDALALTASNSDNVSYNDKFVIAWGSAGWSSPSAGNSQLLVANVTNSTGTWYHLAIVRDSSTSVKMFRNGTQVANATVSSGATFNWGYSGSFVGGGNWDGAQGYFNGYIDDLRVTAGVARYTTTFTPPTQAFPTY